MSLSLDRLFVVVRGNLANASAPYDATYEAQAAAEALQKQLTAWQALEDRGRPLARHLAWRAGHSLTGSPRSLLHGRVSVTNVHLRVEDQHDRGTDPLVLGAVLRGLWLRARTVEDDASHGSGSKRASGVRGRIPDEQSYDASSDSGDKGRHRSYRDWVRKVVEVDGVSLYILGGSSSSRRGSHTRESLVPNVDRMAPDAVHTPRSAEEEAARWEPMMHRIEQKLSSADDVIEPLSVAIGVSLDFRGGLAESNAVAKLGLNSPLALALRHQQFLDLLALGEGLDGRSRREYYRSCGRPVSSGLVAPGEWWKYIGRCAIYITASRPVAWF